VRFGGNMVVTSEVVAEINVLKGIAAAFVMNPSSRKPIYTHQREVLTDLCTELWERPDQLDGHFADDWAHATDDVQRKRIVVDQVASLTDQSAFAWHERLVAP
jgi:dGTPase